MGDRESGQLKRSSASLTGGVFVGIAVAVIAGLLLTDVDIGAAGLEWALAVIIGAAFAGYVRLADL